LSKREWGQFNMSETIRRSLFGATILLSLFTLSWEGVKTIRHKERR
jgi:hypothetical protein